MNLTVAIPHCSSEALMLNHYIQVIHTSRCARGLAMRSADNVLPDAGSNCEGKELPPEAKDGEVMEK